MANEKTKEIDLGGDFGPVALKVNGVRLEVSADGGNLNVVSGAPVMVTGAANVTAPQAPDTVFATESLKVGDRMKDGTVVVAVNLQQNLALFAPEGIFGGSADFHHQNDLVAQVNTQSLLGHKDWRRVTHEEARTLTEVWNKVAPRELQGGHNGLFWGASNHGFGRRYGRVHVGGKPFTSLGSKKEASHPVPVVRGGPAWKC